MFLIDRGSKTPNTEDQKVQVTKLSLRLEWKELFDSQRLGKEGNVRCLWRVLKGSTECSESDKGDLSPSNISLSRKSLSHFRELQTALFLLRGWTD